MASLPERIFRGWNAFRKTDDDEYNISPGVELGEGLNWRPDKTRYRYSNERSIITTMYNRMSTDAAAVDIKHVRLDDNERYLNTINSGLNECLTVEANIDQAARAFKQDIFMSMFEEGVIAIVPVDTTLNPKETGGFDIRTLRVGKIVQWYPAHVKVSIYNENAGNRQEVILPKKIVAIVENPFYSIMNQPNSTLQRLIRKLALLDIVDEASSSGKLDIIIQLPYVVKTETRKAQAKERLENIEWQLKGSKHGIAYTDATEKITQLNRPAENNLLAQVQYLTEMLYSQLGISQAIFEGTADEKEMLNYYNRTLEPLLTSVTEAMTRVFLTKTARTQMQSIKFFRDPFKLVPVNNIAEIADKFTRNEIMSSNEIRGVIGLRPSSDPKADELRNKNLPEVSSEESKEEKSKPEDIGELKQVDK